MGRRTIDPGVRARAVQLYVDGLSLHDAARETGVAQRTVVRWLEAAAIPRRSSASTTPRAQARRRAAVEAGRDVRLERTLRRAYEHGATVTHLAAVHQLPRWRCYALLVRAGTVMRRPGTYRPEALESVAAVRAARRAAGITWRVAPPSYRPPPPGVWRCYCRVHGVRVAAATTCPCCGATAPWRADWEAA